MKRQVLLLVGMAIFTLGLFLYGHHKRIQSRADHNRLTQAMRQERVEEKVVEWNKGAFIPETANQFPSAIYSAIISATNVLKKGLVGDPPQFIKMDQAFDADQREKLAVTVQDFFSTFGNEDIDFDSYVSFKTISRQYKFNFEGIIGQIVTSYTANHKLAIPPNLPDDQKAKLIWETLTADDENRLGGKRPAITSVDLKTIKIWAYEGPDTRNVAGELSLRAVNNMSKAAINTLIKYDETPDKIVKAAGSFKYVAISAICMFNTSKNPGPLVLDFYWSDQDKAWMPWELVTDSSSGYYTLF